MPMPTVLLHKLNKTDVKCIQEILRVEGHLRDSTIPTVGLTDTIVELLSNGSHNDNGNTALHLAFYKFGPGLIFDSLLTVYLNKSTENLTNNDGLSFFHMACTSPYVELVHAILLSYRIDVNCRVSERSLMFSGYSPLHFAAQYHQYEVAKLLLKYNANAQAQDRNFSTPVHIALEQGNMQMANLLLDHSWKHEYHNNGWKLSYLADCVRGNRQTNNDKLVNHTPGHGYPFGNITPRRFAYKYDDLLRAQILKDTDGDDTVITNSTTPCKSNSVCFDSFIAIINIFAFAAFIVLFLPPILF